MKEHRLKLIFCIVLQCLATLVFVNENSFATEGSVVLVATEYPPYYGKNLKNHGFISEIIKEAYKAAGYTVKIDFLPWARALKETKRGRYDGLFTAWYRKEREQWFVYTDPLPPNIIGFYKRKDKDISYKTCQGLKPYVIGVIIGYSNPPAFEAANLKKEEVANNEQNMMKLFKNRIDLALIDKTMGEYIIATKIPEAADVLVWLEPPLEIANQYLIISKKTKDYQRKVEDFNRGLRQLTKNKMIEKIMAKHGF